MSDEIRSEELQSKSTELLNTALKHARTATLAAALMPVGALLMTPVEAHAQTGGPPPTVPEASSLVLLATGLAGAALLHRRRK